MFAMRRSGRSFWADNGAAIAPLYALALFALIGVGGIAFDYARLASMDSELQNAADQAALAAATQLNGDDGAKLAAEGAARNFFATAGYNTTLFANDGDNKQIGDVDAEVNVMFFENRADAEADTNSFTTASTATGETDADAHFVRVTIENRKAVYALTPVVSAIEGELEAHATAGMGSAVCKVPPIMICHPDPSTTIDWDAKAGMGIQATGHNPNNSNNKGGNAGNGSQGSGTTWAPGDFGFLQISDSGDNTSRNAALLKALAYVNPPLDCTPVGENKVSTGNPQGLYDAINTRFDIYDFNSNGSGNVLAPCIGGTCPPAPNVVKDFVNSNPAGNNGCKIKNGGGASPGWTLPSAGQEFKPVTKSGSTNATQFDDNGVIQVMGLPRDNCHYTSYNGTGLCSGGTGRFGNKLWDRADYFKVNHTSGGTTTYPSNWQNITRYDTYLWELENNNMPNGTGATSQRGRPVCGGTSGGAERRVLTVAVVTNCSALHGTSVAVDIDEWVDVFLVEPSIDNARRYNAFKDGIYMEVIGKSKTAGGYTYGVQTVRRDVPYLVR